MKIKRTLSLITITLFMTLNLFSAFAQEESTQSVSDNTSKQYVPDLEIAEISNSETSYSISIPHQTYSFSNQEAFFTTNNLGLKTSYLVNDITNPVVYQINLEAGFYLDTIYRTGSDQKDGSIGIFNQDGEIIDAIILLPLTDAMGNIIESDYTISNSTIAIQSLQIDNIAYPIDSGLQTLSSATYSDFFLYSVWESRSNGITLSIHRNLPNWETINGTAGMAAIGNMAWPLLKAEHQYDSNWTNETSIRNQYNCHVGSAYGKDPWNLEPWRPVVSEWEMIMAACNP